MSQGPQYIKDQAMKAAALRLQQAATFAQLNIKNPLFQRRIGKGRASVLVRLDWPGVLAVIDPETGELLAASEVGRPDVLRTGFTPALPAQIRNTLGRIVQGGAA